MGYEKIVTLAERCAKYAQDYGKRSILETKPISIVNFSELGVCLSDGTVHFQNEESAIKYIFNRLHKALDLPQEQQFERVIVKRGTTIVGEADGIHTECTSAFHSIKGISERISSKLEVPRDLEMYHSHPDMFGKGRTTPLSDPCNGDINTLNTAKLKKVVAVNSKGEFNSMTITPDFTTDKFSQFQEYFDKVSEEKLIGELIKRCSKLRQERMGYRSKGQRIPKALNEEIDTIEKELVKIQKEGVSEEVAKVMHECYKKADQYGLKYKTNFSNLLNTQV